MTWPAPARFARPSATQRGLGRTTAHGLVRATADGLTSPTGRNSAWATPAHASGHGSVHGVHGSARLHMGDWLWLCARGRAWVDADCWSRRCQRDELRSARVTSTRPSPRQQSGTARTTRPGSARMPQLESAYLIRFRSARVIRLGAGHVANLTNREDARGVGPGSAHPRGAGRPVAPGAGQITTRGSGRRIPPCAGRLASMGARRVAAAGSAALARTSWGGARD
jgi:hypothetical protein